MCRRRAINLKKKKGKLKSCLSISTLLEYSNMSEPAVGNGRFNLFQVKFKNTDEDNLIIKSSDIPKTLANCHPIEIVSDYIDGDENTNDLPSGFTPFREKVAGHNSLAKQAELDQILIDNNTGHLWKLLKVEKPNKSKEVLIYEQLMDKKIAEKAGFRRILKHVAKCYGIGYIGTYSYILLENLCHGYTQPSVVDIKIGRRSTSHKSFDKKENKECGWKETHRILGFFVPGMRVSKYNSQEGEWETHVYNKDYSRELIRSLDDQIAMFKLYLEGCDNISLRRAYCRHFLRILYELLEYFESQTRYTFYRSSLLLGYDSGESIFKTHASVHLPCFLKMIDFEHITENTKNKETSFKTKKDKIYGLGIEHLIEVFEKISVDYTVEVKNYNNVTQMLKQGVVQVDK